MTGMQRCPARLRSLCLTRGPGVHDLPPHTASCAASCIHLSVVLVVLQGVLREKQAVLRHAVKQTMSVEGSYRGVAREMADLKAKLM